MIWLSVAEKEMTEEDFYLDAGAELVGIYK